MAVAPNRAVRGGKHDVEAATSIVLVLGQRQDRW